MPYIAPLRHRRSWGGGGVLVHRGYNGAMYSLVQLNIEGDKHLPLVTDFLHQQNADILCLEEVFRGDIPHIASGYAAEFLPMFVDVRSDGTYDERGIALCTKTPCRTSERAYYYRAQEALQVFDRTNEQTKQATVQHGLLVGEVAPNVRVGVVHHTWTQNGDAPNEHQKRDTAALLSLIQTLPPMIVCGDFNIPRAQSELYRVLTSILEDCVPATYTSSMYVPLHRVRNDPYRAQQIKDFMVDYVFRAKNAPAVSDVEMHCGMSDHCALSARVQA